MYLNVQTDCVQLDCALELGWTAGDIGPDAKCAGSALIAVESRRFVGLVAVKRYSQQSSQDTLKST